MEDEPPFLTGTSSPLGTLFSLVPIHFSDKGPRAIFTGRVTTIPVAPSNDPRVHPVASSTGRLQRYNLDAREHQPHSS